MQPPEHEHVIREEQRHGEGWHEAQRERQQGLDIGNNACRPHRDHQIEKAEHTNHRSGTDSSHVLEHGESGDDCHGGESEDDELWSGERQLRKETARSGNGGQG